VFVDEIAVVSQPGFDFIRMMRLTKATTLRLREKQEEHGRLKT